MPLDTETYVLDEEIASLEDNCQELAEKLAGLEADNPAASQLQQLGQQLDSRLGGLRWAREQWDVDSVTLGGLTGGEYGYVEDEMGGGGQGKARVYFVAKGTLDAPYLEDTSSFDDIVANVSALPIGYLRWADNRIEELMTPSGNDSQGFGDYLAEARSKKTSTES